MIRPLHPTDMPSYLAFTRRACYGQGPDACGPSGTSASLVNFLGHSLSFDVPNHTWVYADRRRIRGLVSIRNRRGAAIWQIERLLGLDAGDSDSILEDLLEHLATVGAEEGIQKIFLQLPSASPLVPVARRAGFVSYAQERVYCGSRQPNGAQDPGVRPRRAVDHLALFEHYSRTVPPRVRQAEAMTLQEWRWLDGWTPPRQLRLRLSRARRDFVLDDSGQLRAWLLIEPTRRMAHVSLEHSDAGRLQADEMLALALDRLPGSVLAYVPVRDYEGILEAAVVRRAMQPISESTLLVNLLTVRVPDRCLVPVGA